MKKIMVLVLLIGAVLQAMSLMKTSLVKLRRDLASWQIELGTRTGDMYAMPMTRERKRVDSDYAIKFQSRIDSAVKALKSAGLDNEANTVLFFRDAPVSPLFKQKLEEFQRFLGELE